MAKSNTPKTKKASSSSSGSRRKAPRKAATKKADKTPRLPPVVPSSEWRASTVPRDQKITKTDAVSKYRLKSEDFKKLPPPEKHITIAGYESLLYSERDVERAAWERHGGPDRFVANLERLRKSYEKRYPGKLFPAPTDYAALADGSVTILSLPRGTDIFAMSTTNRALKNRLIKKASGEDWLWMKCNLFLMPDPVYGHPGEAPPPGEWSLALRVAADTLPQYPPRTPLPAQPSPQFVALQRVLDDAPTKGIERDPRVKEETNSWPDSTTYYYWSPKYFTRVYEALIEIIRVHGVGDDGWRAARWMVYDKYAETWSGVALYQDHMSDNRDRWGRRPWIAEDNAYGWLQGRLPKDHRSLLKLEFGLYKDEPPAIWKKYNSLLPVNHL